MFFKIASRENKRETSPVIHIILLRLMMFLQKQILFKLQESKTISLGTNAVVLTMVLSTPKETTPDYQIQHLCHSASFS